MRRLMEWIRDDLPQGIHNLIRFFPVVWRFRAWDFVYVLDLLREGLRLLVHCVDEGMEADDTRIPKVQAMTRVITLLDHAIADHYLALIDAHDGPGSSDWSVWEPIDDDRQELIDVRDQDTREHDAALLDRAHALETREWHELWDTLRGDEDVPGSDMRGWWN